MLLLVSIWLHTAQLRQKQYAAQRRCEVGFAVYEKLLLNTRFMKLQVPCGGTAKLLPRWIGPFPIVQCMARLALKGWHCCLPA